MSLPSLELSRLYMTMAELYSKRAAQLKPGGPCSTACALSQVPACLTGNFDVQHWRAACRSRRLNAEYRARSTDRHAWASDVHCTCNPADADAAQWVMLRQTVMLHKAQVVLE